MHSPANEYFQKEFKTAEDLLSAIRKGNSQKLELGLGDIKIPCRLLNASEEAIITVKAKQRALANNPAGIDQKYFEAICIMQDMLQAATTVGGTPNLPVGFLQALSKEELTGFYDQFVSLNHTLNPNLQTMKPEEITSLVQGIKKKTHSSKNLYTWQVQEIGRWFLDVVLPSLPMDNAAGGDSVP